VRFAGVLCLFLVGCGDGEDGAGPTAGPTQTGTECSGSGSRFATAVVEHSFGTGQDFGQDTFPAPVLGPPAGGGCCKGSLDVTSLGEGGFVTLEFANNSIVDGPGPDFIVFENAFQVDESDPASVFAELGSVAVSEDGETWVGYECQAAEYPFTGCAGWRPTLANADESELGLLDPEAAGGDAFDLAELGLESARYVRIEDWPDEDESTFDLDAVGIVNAACP
jgi:hypothetical protein